MARRREQGQRRALQEKPQPRCAIVTSQTSRQWGKWLGWGILICLLPFIAQTIYGVVQLLRYPFEANFGEGGVLYDAIRLARGEAIYQRASLAERWFSPYPPLYQWLVSLIGTRGFFAARLISALASLTSSVSLFVLLRRGGLNRSFATFGAALWLISPFVNVWSGLARVDMLGRGLESLAVVTLVALPAPLKWRWIGALIMAVLAMFVKQSMVAGALTCIGFLWFERRRAALSFAAVWACATALGYSGLTFATQGEFFRNVFLDAARSLDWRMLWQWLLFGLVLSHVPQLVLAGIGGRIAWRNERLRVLPIATAAGIPSILLSAHDGADVNYYFDFIWGASGLAATGLHELASATGLGRRIAAIATGCAVLLFAWLMPMRWPDLRQRRQADKVQTLLRRASQPVLAEFIGFALAAGTEPRCVPYLDKKLEERGKWNPGVLVERIRRQEYGAIHLTSQAENRWSTTVLDTISRHYRVVQEFPEMFAAEGAPSFVVLEPAR